MPDDVTPSLLAFDHANHQVFYVAGMLAGVMGTRRD